MDPVATQSTPEQAGPQAQQPLAETSQEQTNATPTPKPDVAQLSYPESPKSGILGKFFLILLGLMIVSSIAGVSYYLGMQKGNSQQANKKTTVIKNVTVLPTLTPTPTPDITASWSAYTNTQYGYTVKYPTSLKKTENNTYYHYVSFDPAGAHILPTFLISVIADAFVVKDIAAYNYMSSDWINSFYTMKIGETKTTSSGATFTKLEDTTVDGQLGMVVEVVTPTYKQHRIYVKMNGDLYMISNSYQTQDELSNFTVFLSTFKFIK